MTTLEEYSKEIYGNVKAVLTLDELIESHRQLRNLNIEAQKYRMNAMSEGFDIGVKQGLESINDSYIKVEDLMKMTMSEVADYLNDFLNRH